MKSPNSRGQFAPIEGLRAYLAIWVAIQHGLQSSGYFHLPGAMNVFLRGDEAVNVFIILSGFVITQLLLTSSESYTQYITRRFFRLMPLFAVGCVATYFVLGKWSELVHHVPWQHQAASLEYASSVDQIAFESRYHTLPHAILHATLLHGLIPAEILPSAPTTFLPAAWSISLEWQFYLLAPFVIRWSRNAGSLLVLLCVAAAGVYLFRSGRLGTYYVTSTILASSGYFAVGICARIFFANIKSVITACTTPLKASSVAVFLLFCFAKGELGLMVWLPFYFYMMDERSSRFRCALDAIFMNRLALTLGAASYSLYLAHRPIQVFFGYLAVSMNPNLSQGTMIIAQGLAICVAIVVAYFLWKWIEIPGQALGKQMILRYSPRNRLST